MTQRQARHPGQEPHGRPPGEELERISQEDALHVADGLHPGCEAHDLRLLHDDPGVGHSQTVEEVHQDNHDEENKHHEE